MATLPRSGSGATAGKLFAARVEADAEDIAFLYRKLGYTTVDDGLDLVQSAYRGRPIDAKVQFLLRRSSIRSTTAQPMADALPELAQAWDGLPSRVSGLLRRPGPRRSSGSRRRRVGGRRATARAGVSAGRHAAVVAAGMVAAESRLQDIWRHAVVQASSRAQPPVVSPAATMAAVVVVVETAG
ncbi:hypothetical protein FrEUN1fDRAFT_1126 [Parafrankia sp. EUN1f]|nr:hypothetical protein FrEUN1fDRAFT_1126 [Parafrankia sp. EUN1f]